MATGLQERVASRIVEARAATGLSQREFGLKVGAAARTVQTWEHGQRIPRTRTFERVAEVTGHPVSWFYADDEPMAA